MVQRLKSLTKEKIDITEIDHQVIRLAALLHDIGHYPLSHTIENCFKEYGKAFLPDEPKGVGLEEGKVKKIKNHSVNKFKKEFLNPGINLKDFLQDFPDLPKSNAAERFDHEKVSKELVSNKRSPLYTHLSRILQNIYTKFNDGKLLSEDEIDSYLHLIGQLICGNPKYAANPILKDNRDKYFILSLLINSHLDADQMDYMLRDTKNTGIQATIRTDFLIDNMDICYITVEGKPQKVLCFNLKALESVQQFIISKAYYYTEILYYDKVCIYNEIAKRLYLYIICNEKENEIKSLNSFYNIIYDVDKYCSFDDNYFWNCIKKLNQDSDTPKIIKKLINILIGRYSVPKSLSLNNIKILNEEYKTYFKTSVKQIKTNDTIKNEICAELSNKLKNELYITKFFSRKFFEQKTEEICKRYSDRSIYILLSECEKSTSCYKKCNRAVKLVDREALGELLLHKILFNCKDEENKTIEDIAYVEKCVIYDFQAINS